MMSISTPIRPSRRQRRKSSLIGSCVTFVIILVIYYNHGWLTQSASTSLTSTKPSSEPVNPLLEEQVRFWRSFYHIILNNDPQCDDPPDRVIPEDLGISFESDHERSRPDVLWMDKSDIERMRVAHQNFIHDVHSANVKLVYNEGTRGIVTTISDLQIPVLLTQLRMLRATESTLPVEVFLSQSTAVTDYVCDNILRSLNAKCVYISQIFRTAKTGVDVAHYQFKILAILFSSFEELLLLDSDAWPVHNPDHLFVTEPFLSTGLVLWPDFWYPSESPYYFTIANISEIPALNAKPATESGEMLYAKSRHAGSIMLAAYYNHYGPDYYYPLQSQGAPGEGDKETFGLAALALDEPFYLVRTMVQAIGRTDSSGHFFGTAMVQYDPAIDYGPVEQQAQAPDGDTSNRSSATITSPSLSPSSPSGKPLFIHANVPKFDPRTIFASFDLGNSGLKTSPAIDTNGTMVRPWTRSAAAAVQKFGYDVERRFWDVMRRVACEDLVVEDDHVDGALLMRHGDLICQRLRGYFDVVFGE